MVAKIVEECNGLSICKITWAIQNVVTCNLASKVINRHILVVIFSVQMLMLSNRMKWFLLQSFMDVQFPNGQVTYVAGEGITASGFVPLLGGLLQAHGKFPGETRMSFSCKVSIFNLIHVISSCAL